MKRCLVAVACGLALSACGGSPDVDPKRIEQEIQNGLVDQLGPETEADVTCPSSLDVKAGQEFDCVAKFDDGSSARVTGRWQNAKGEYVWRVG